MKPERTKEDDAAERFFNENYSGTETSDFLKPYIINTYKAASQFREPSTEQSGGTEQEIERLKETLSSYRMLLKELWFQNKTGATVSETFLQTIDKALHP